MASIEYLYTAARIMSAKKKTLGIIGGMGPMATADLFHKIIANTDADCDAGHIRIFIDNNPAIPDRTKAVLEGSDAPLAFLAEAARNLARMGADLLLLPCNTSHAYYPQLCEAACIPIINMIEETAAHAASLGFKRVGLLATKGTLHARLYENALAPYGIEAVVPGEAGQDAVMALIYGGVKAGAQTYDTAAVRGELERMKRRGAETFILGCTELPLAFEKYGLGYPAIDPALILARAAIVRSGYRVRP